MVFSSLLFLFLYLPCVLLVYFLLPAKARNGFLLLANLLFYAWGEPVFVLVMLLSIFINYGFGLILEKQEKGKKPFFVVAVILNFALLFFFKYAEFFREMVASVTGLHLVGLSGIALPIGISFYTFQAVSYLIDIYRKEIKAQSDLIAFGTYLSFFPQLIAGPIVRYSEMAAALEERKVTMAQFAEGVRLFILGLAKKVLIANEMGLLWEHLQGGAAQDGALAAWIGICAFALQIYFDFSGYSDMARGLGNMFGFRLPINFRYPYEAKSVTEFWRRWHITLTRWFRDYLYIPLGGNRRGGVRTVVNLFIVWSLTGLWHGADYHFVTWGIYWFFCLAGEKFLWGKALEKCPAVLRHGYALVLILVGWVIFAMEDMAAVALYLKAMFYWNNGLLHGDSLVYVLSYLPLLFIAIFAALPYGRNLWLRISEKKIGSILSILGLMLLLVLSIAALVDQSYNPFLYFRF